MTDLNEKFKNIQGENDMTASVDALSSLAEANQYSELEYPLNKLFQAGESESFKEPTESQWEKFQYEFVKKISKLEKPKFLSEEWFTLIKDKITSTDSTFIKFSFYLIIAAVLIVVCFIGYLLASLFSTGGGTQLSGVSNIINAAADISRLFLS